MYATTSGKTRDWSLCRHLDINLQSIAKCTAVLHPSMQVSAFDENDPSPHFLDKCLIFYWEVIFTTVRDECISKAWMHVLIYFGRIAR